MSNRNILGRTLVLAALTALSACSQKDKAFEPENLKENPRGIQIHDEASLGPSGDDKGNWFVRDPGLDGLEGVGSERAIEEFQLKHEKEIVVAVIDSGVDVEHEDLRGKIWINADETGVDKFGRDKATNNIDDDGNGYVDDVYGWNFIGGKDGKNVSKDTLEVTRELVRYETRIKKGEVLTKEEAAYFEKVHEAYKAEKEQVDKVLEEAIPEEKKATAAKSLLKEKAGLEDYSKEALEGLKSSDDEVISARDTLLEIIEKYRSVARFYRVFEYYSDVSQYYLNKEFNSRDIVGDDPGDFSDTNYGNNDVEGPDASHGTHVAGIIGAIRNNDLGINGVAENVKIMALRVVPDGDERDKDVALAVRYAVDNGAHIINMSFGKSFSPHKKEVDKAFVYAAEKGVLIFHSAGNDSSDNDLVPGYPNRRVKDAKDRNLPEQISTWLEIGASADTANLNLVASFSDYGKVDVDLFSPGHLLNSTVPDNKYDVYSGTSMAGPAAAGVAALLMSNFPEMTARQAKAIVLHQIRKYPGLMVKRPGSDKFDLPVLFEGLSASGGVIDAYASVKLAKELLDN